jgi:hypothetical protein
MNTRHGYSIDPKYERHMPLVDWDDAISYKNAYAGDEPTYYDEQGLPYWEPLLEEET